MFTAFPELFDGVVRRRRHALTWHRAAVAAAWTVSVSSWRRPGLRWRRCWQAFSIAQLRRVAQEVLDRCDAADGLADGLVSGTALCRVNPQRLVARPVASCLSAEQARALAAMMAGPVNRGAADVGWPWDGPGGARQPMD